MSASRPYGIIGGGGEGKSVYMSLLCSAVRARGVRASILFCGDNAFSASVRNAAEALLHLLTEASGGAYDYEACAILTHEELISHLINLRPSVKERCCFFLDAVDQCEDGMLSFISWCADFLGDQVTVVFSSRMTPELREKERSFTLAAIGYDREDYRRMAGCILSEYAKSLSDSLVAAVLDKTETPLQLHLLLLRLLNLSKDDFDAINKAGGGIGAINAYLSRVIADSPADTSALVLSYLSVLLSESANLYFYSMILNLLAFSGTGMYEDDIRRAFEIATQPWVELDYLDFLSRFGFFIRVRDNGRLDLSHDIIRQALVQVSASNRGMMCYLIALSLSEREEQDPTTVRAFFNAVVGCGHAKMLADFVTRRSEEFHTSRGVGIVLELQKLYFRDGGKFLTKSLSACGDLSELMTFISMISAALLDINGYYDERTVIGIAGFAMSIYLLTVSVGAGMLEAELLSCEMFLRRHDVSEPEIEKFLALFREKIAEYTAQAQVTDVSHGKTPEEMLDFIRRAKDPAEAAPVWLELSMLLKGMVNNPQTAARAERSLLRMLDMLENGVYSLDEPSDTLSYADIYTSLGSACKTQKRWEDALRFEEKGAEIYLRLYEENPSPDHFRKYRERVYNLANVAEACALTEDSDRSLWERTRAYFEKVYEMELTALSKGLSERDAVHAASVIFSLGTALLKTGREDEGVQKYREGAALIEEITGRVNSPALNAKLAVKLMECFYHLSYASRLEDAYPLVPEICRRIVLVAGSNDESAAGSVREMTNSFSGLMNDKIAELHDADDLDGQLALSRALAQIYTAYAPIAPPEVRANIIILYCNACAILFWQKQDYTAAYDELSALARLVEEKDLAAPDENGRHMDQANARLLDVYVRRVVCLDKLGRKDELFALIGEAESVAVYIAAHLDFIRGDTPRVLYEMFSTLMRYQSPLAPLFLSPAIEAIQREGYDRKAHPDTVRMIVDAVRRFRDAMGGD